MDLERCHEEILRAVVAELHPRLDAAVRGRDQDAGDIAIKSALTKGIVEGLRRGFEESTEQINEQWRVAVEGETGQTVELVYRPPADVEIPDVWAELYGGDDRDAAD